MTDQDWRKPKNDGDQTPGDDALDDRDDTLRYGQNWQGDADGQVQGRGQNNAGQVLRSEGMTGEGDPYSPEMSDRSQTQARSDREIYEEAKQRLSTQGQVDASNVYIDVDHGAVTLRGAVANQDEKRMAEVTLIPITGVIEVNNELQIHQNKSAHTRGPGQEEADRPSTQED